MHHVCLCDRCVYRSPDPLRTEAAFLHGARHARADLRLRRYGDLAQPHRRRDGRAVARPRGIYERRRLHGHDGGGVAAGRYCERSAASRHRNGHRRDLRCHHRLSHRHSGAASPRRLSRHCDACLRRDHQEHFHEPLYRPGQPRLPHPLPAGARKSGGGRKAYSRRTDGYRRRAEDRHVHRRLYPRDALPHRDLPSCEQPHGARHSRHPR